MLLLGEYSGQTEQFVKDDIATHYGSSNYGEKDPIIASRLEELEIVVALLESYDYEESSFFIFKEKNSNRYYELYASHCSCYGFENQFDLEETSLDILRDQAKSGRDFRYNYDEIGKYIFSLE